MIIDEIRKRSDLVDLVNEIGFLPFFSCRIEGFSLEENVSYEAWYQGRWKGRVHWDAWDWKGEVLREKELVYGKFFEKKAGFISMKLWPDFCNYRRDGYDFDARVSDGLVNYNDEYLYNIISSKHSILSKTAKAIGGYVKPREKGKDVWQPRKGFDTSITSLQMMGYVIITDFDYEMDRNGNFYGWGIARYSTPEEFFGKTFARRCYKRSPEESYKRLFKHLKKLNHEADEYAIRIFLNLH
jgi:hypothetical protein